MLKLILVPDVGRESLLYTFVLPVVPADFSAESFLLLEPDFFVRNDLNSGLSGVVIVLKLVMLF